MNTKRGGKERGHKEGKPSVNREVARQAAVRQGIGNPRVSLPDSFLFLPDSNSLWPLLSFLVINALQIFLVLFLLFVLRSIKSQTRFSGPVRQPCPTSPPRSATPPSPSSASPSPAPTLGRSLSKSSRAKNSFLLFLSSSSSSCSCMRGGEKSSSDHHHHHHHHHLFSFSFHMPHFGHHGHGEERERDNEGKMVPPKGWMGIRVGGEGEEQKRFVVPVGYLNHPLFKDLLEEAEEEYGFEQKGAITLPCGVEHFRQVQGIIERDCAAAARRHHHHGGGGGGAQGHQHHYHLPHFAGCFKA